MPRPQDIQAFLAPPTREMWDQMIRDGWAGPEGSSMSRDHIAGVRIGRTGAAFADAFENGHWLPANLHDWAYLLGRVYELPMDWRHRADVVYRRGCIATLRRELLQDDMPWTLRLFGALFLALGFVNAWIRYVGLRVLGRWSFRV